MHPKQEELEDRMSLLCQELDNHLEDVFGTRYTIHPNRLKRGQGSNPIYDGLFSTSMAFTLGYGSKYGRGYVVNVEVRTLDKVSQYDKVHITSEAFSFLSEKLRDYFPDHPLEVVQDGNVMKIIGDFGLGEV